ncbi:MAG: hypothetical protein U1F27_01285 [Turneriella sp.]
MIIGVPKEIKKLEFRVAMTAEGVREAVNAGHQVIVEQGAGTGSGIDDAAYAQAGADVLPREEIFRRADLIVKVKEPLAAEYSLFRAGQILFTYLHLAPDRAQTEALLKAGVTAFAYETLEVDGELRFTHPQAKLRSRMAPLMGCSFCRGSAVRGSAHRCNGRCDGALRRARRAGVIAQRGPRCSWYWRRRP